MSTYQPQPAVSMPPSRSQNPVAGSQRATSTVPAAAACTTVPRGAARSTPLWFGRCRVRKPELTGARTGAGPTRDGDGGPDATVGWRAPAGRSRRTAARQAGEGASSPWLPRRIGRPVPEVARVAQRPHVPRLERVALAGRHEFGALQR